MVSDHSCPLRALYFPLGIGLYPMPLETSGKNDVEVGRLRYDESVENGLNFWVCGDQIRKGAALNALQIAEYMIEHDMF